MTEFKRVEMPQATEAEKAVLGSILLWDRAMDEVADMLTPESFYGEGHQAIWKAMVRRFEADRKIDALIIATDLKSTGELELCGGDSALIDILETVPNAAHVKYYAEQVKQAFIERELARCCSDTLGQITGPARTENIGEILATVDQRISDIQQQQLTGESVSIGDILLDSLATLAERASGGIKHSRGIPMGFADLDSVTGGMRPGEVIILAARPSMGKTSLLCSILRNLSIDGKSCLMFSLEQSKEELGDRMMCIQGKLDASRLTRGEMDEVEVDILLTAAGEASKWPIFIDDKADRTMAQIMAQARRQKRRKGLDIIVIDYLQLIEPENGRIPREQQVAVTSRKIKQLAKIMGVPVIALAQLNREIETRPDKRPKLSDLRESGSIEQDADMVIFLNRPEVYDPDDRPGEADLTVAKNRNGPTGTARLAWISKSMRFESMAEQVPDVPDFLTDFE